MDLATLDISPEEAKEKLAHYEALLQDERTAEDDAIAAGYRAAARGLPVIILSETIAAGGFFPNGLPRIAVCRADAKVCHAEVSRSWRTGRDSIVFADRDRDRGHAAVGRYRVEVPLPEPHQGRRLSGRTVVPLVPPEHRPRRPRRLARCHILWEVEKWDLTPPRDPALIRHIRGDLWSVLAVWDLTDLERAVLSSRSGHG